MLVLGIETASPTGSAALLEGDEILLELRHDGANAHAERVLALVDELFRSCRRRRSDVSKVGVGVGPGSFTGLRVGIALAQGIGLGLGVPVLGIPSLTSMTRESAALRPGFDFYGSLLDARRGEVFVGLFDARGQTVVPVQTLNADGLARQLRSLLAQAPAGKVLLSGEFADRQRAQLVEEGFEVQCAAEARFPAAGWTARLASELTPGSGAEAVPMYVREPDAVLPRLAPNPLALPETEAGDGTPEFGPPTNEIAPTGLGR
ncbi:MAG: hypothetical protein RJA70_2262 [Pseudomonadota bacterium]|jgi:tRNA threonylcarbamoyladenosine biosynthesis protein TsaB